MAGVLSSPGTRHLVLLAVTVLAVALSLAIVHQAYRGYRRHASRTMAYLAVGLFLLTVVPYTLAVLVSALGPQLGFRTVVYTFYWPIVSQAFSITGLGCILYSLYMRR